MADLNRISALHGAVDGDVATAVDATVDAAAAEVVLGEIGGLALQQIAAWADTVDAVGRIGARAAGVDAAPGPGRAAESADAALLRIEPLKWWLIGDAKPLDLDAEQGAVVDLSHARARIRIAGPCAAEFLNRHLPLDLRESAFPAGRVASSQLHHVGVTLWRAARGYDLFIPRGYALSVWEVLLQTAAQFDAEIRHA